MLHPDRRHGRAARTPEARLEEAVGLAEAIDLEVAGAEVLRLDRPNPGTFFGAGQVQRIAGEVEQDKIGLVVVDGALSPVQQRNLERAWKAKVIDRTGLILEIFGARARTREGQLQVERAALAYQRSRLVRSWTHLERQRGGFGFLGGPGESQLEIDRRLIADRIDHIDRDLERVRRTRLQQRKGRGEPVVALVGYTNAGKSTLFNRLTQAGVFAENLLFATLDPTMRRVTLPNGRSFVLSDTVGFISELPTQLVAAFRATLEEVLQADLVLHVRDAAHPDSAAQREDVRAVLNDLGLAPDEPDRVIEVLNKIDLIPHDLRSSLKLQAARDPALVALSAVTGEGIDSLFARLEERLGRGERVLSLRLPLADGATLAWLYAHGQVLSRRDHELEAELEVRLNHADAARLERRLGNNGSA
ncbi:MAG TPA: GTPase HflX [Kiloniellales bacterium]|nr:GTPase HflX [Kiloniellales bacterium]